MSIISSVSVKSLSRLFISITCLFFGISNNVDADGFVDPIELSQVAIAANTAGFVINGADAVDYAGFAVSGAGDVNGDGLDDFIVGAYLADPNGDDSGASYVVFGRTDSPVLELSQLESGSLDGFVINGVNVADSAGCSVSDAGDVNGDGLDDLIIGAYHADPNGNESGASYVVFGKADTAAVELSQLETGGVGGFVINGVDSNDQSGFSVSGAGDVNGDSLADLLIGAYQADPNGGSSGASYVVFGKADTAAVELSQLEAGGSGGFVINGAGGNDRSGFSVSGAEDVNGDSLADLLIGAYQADPNSVNAGASYVVFGKVDTTAVELSQLEAGGVGGFVINGAGNNDYSGRSVSGVGDVNGDSLADLLIGAYQADPNSVNAGASYVVFGKADTAAVELSQLEAGGVGGFVINGVGSNDRSGYPVSGAGDVNGDSLADLLIGAYQADPNGGSSGASYVVFGKTDTAAVELSQLEAGGPSGFVINGKSNNDQSGRGVSGAGDVNGDGLGDLLIGAYLADPNGDSSGAAYLVYSPYGGIDSDGDGVGNGFDVFPDDPTEWADLDGDGIGDNADTDRDGDGVDNEQDAFPDDVNEWSDLDGDGIGDNADLDRDGDGVENDLDAFPNDPSESSDLDGDSIGDNADPDRDGDGVPNVSDLFPNDPTEWADLDGDGIGDNSDPDRDNDGYTNEEEAQAGSDPDDVVSEPADLDGDSIADAVDTDIDGDGVDNDLDAFPLDATETTDTDGDGIGDNTDADLDGDTYLNDEDEFPSDETEWADLDGDGTGDNADLDRDGDGVNNDLDEFPDNPTLFGIPDVTIDSPANLSTVGITPITVSGTVDDLNARLTINGVEVTHNGTYSADVTLEEGSNTIIVRATDDNDQDGLATLSISLDLTPPTITLQSHQDGQTVYSSSATITGLVNDIVRGTVTEDEAQVWVNGQAANVSNRSFSATGVALIEGQNDIQVVAQDAVGNQSLLDFELFYEVPATNLIDQVSGEGQSAEILTSLANPLIVRLTTDGNPVVGKEVIFRVVEGDGLLANTAGGDSDRAAMAYTDANGEAQIFFTIGARAGVSNHQVRARAVGFDGEVIFHASGNYAAGDVVAVIDGNNQRGAISQPLPKPLTVAVTDSGANLIPNAQVSFEVLRGSGNFSNGQSLFVTNTDMDGRASAQFTMGLEEGLDQQRVMVSLSGTEATTVFTLSGLVPGDPGDTSINGIVLNNQDEPMPGVTVRVDGYNREAITDSGGLFFIENVPVGAVHLIVEGSTTSLPGEWPSLSYNLVTVSGARNPLPAPIYLVEIDTENAVLVGVEDVNVTHPDLPGFNLFVKAGSVTFPDGSNEGLLSVTPVNANKVPMPPPNGMQPQLIVTIQPHGAVFDPAAPLTIPNTDGHAPGAEVEMYSYDHDLEEFVTIGLGTVSDDGSTLTSNPGSGVVKAGWHCGSQPGSSCDVNDDGIDQFNDSDKEDYGSADGPEAPLTNCPINYATGNKYKLQSDYVGSGAFPLTYERHFNSGSGWTNFPYIESPKFRWTTRSSGVEGTFGGEHYFHVIDKTGKANIHTAYYFYTIRPLSCGNTGNCSGGGTNTSFDNLAEQDDGRYLLDRFRGEPGVTTDLSALLPTNQMGFLPSWDLEGTSYFFQDEKDLIYEFDHNFQIIKITNRAGLSHTYNWTDTSLEIVHTFGHKLTFLLDEAGNVVRMTDPDGGIYLYDYDANDRLTSVNYPNGQRREYVYDNPGPFGPDEEVPYLITQVIDINQASYQSEWLYNNDGRAFSSAHFSGNNRDQIDYSNVENREAPSSTVTNALGQKTTYQFDDFWGVKKNVSAARQASGSVQSAQMAYEFFTPGEDQFGNEVQVDSPFMSAQVDWNGNRTEYVRNDRDLIEQLTEAVGTADERVTNISWHADYRLPLQVVEPQLTRDFTYDDNGNLLTYTETDPATAESRTTTMTYNPYGQVLSIDGPRLDLSDLSSFVYTVDGNLESFTNALNQTTTFDTYDAHRNVTEMTDPNGVTIRLDYDAMRRVTGIEREKGGLIASTQLAYDGVGNLINIMLPEGETLTIEYDGVYRPVLIADEENNRIRMTYDSASNLVAQEMFDENGQLAYQFEQVFDSLSRVTEQITANNSDQFAYDPNDNLSQWTDASVRQYGRSYDSLNRLVSTLDPEAGSATFTYDTMDRLTSVTDENGNTTNYSYNGFGDLLELDSPDTGITTYSYDSAGNLSESTDARGETTQYSYDALNRVITASYVSDSSLNITYSYDATNGIGLLAGMADESGSTGYQYDDLGRMTLETRTIEGAAHATGYSYDLSDNLMGITYPSGLELSYTRDALRRVTQIDLSDPSTGFSQTLAQNIDYLPFGPVQSLDYGNGLTLSRTYATDYLLHEQQLIDQTTAELKQHISYSYNGHGEIDGITNTLDSTLSQTFGYDSLGRIDLETTENTDTSIDYDALGNRLSFTIIDSLNNTTETQTLTYENGSSQLIQKDDLTLIRDAVGNKVQELDGITETQAWGYNARNRLQSYVKDQSTAATYLYNGLGQRVQKTRTDQTAQEQAEEGNLTQFHYDLSGQLIQTTHYNGTTPVKERHYLWLGNMPLGYLETDNLTNQQQLHYLTPDHLNTPRLATDQSQTTTWTWHSDAFGSTQANTDPDNDTNHLRINLRFAGQFYDQESGTHYNYFRDYDPSIGRYIQSDPIGLAGGMNTFGYVNGSPLLMLDIYGLVGGQMGRRNTGQGLTAAQQVQLVTGLATIAAGVLTGGTLPVAAAVLIGGRDFIEGGGGPDILVLALGNDDFANSTAALIDVGLLLSSPFKLGKAFLKAFDDPRVIKPPKLRDVLPDIPIIPMSIINITNTFKDLSTSSEEEAFDGNDDC